MNFKEWMKLQEVGTSTGSIAGFSRIAIPTVRRQFMPHWGEGDPFFTSKKKKKKKKLDEEVATFTYICNPDILRYGPKYKPWWYLNNRTEESLQEEWKKVFKENIDTSMFDPKELKMGIEIEKEHDGGEGKDVDVVSSKEDLIKIVVAHLREDPKYYTKLKKAGL